MLKSETIKNIAKALSQFQAEIKNPKNTENNPFFNSKYAPLNEILNISRPILAKYGLSVLQSPSSDGQNVTISTILMHESGEWIEPDALTLKADKVSAQGAGSAITYARRYAISAILGISSEDDDDGNHAEGNSKPNNLPRTGQTTHGSTDTISKTQAKNMYTLSGSNADLCSKVIGKYGYKKSDEVKKVDYEKICKEIEEVKKKTKKQHQVQEQPEVEIDPSDFEIDPADEDGLPWN